MFFYMILLVWGDVDFPDSPSEETLGRIGDFIKTRVINGGKVMNWPSIRIAQSL